MNLETIEKICNSFDDVTSDIKWENHVCFSVGGKMFLITAPDDVPVSASFKCSDERFDELSEREGCKPAPYLAKYKWVYIDDINRFGSKEWKEILAMSHHVIQSKQKSKKSASTKKKANVVKKKSPAAKKKK